MMRLVTGLMVALLIVAPRPGNAAPAAPAVAKAYIAGEVLTFDLAWLKVLGGRGTMSIAPVDGDPSRLRITSEVASNDGISRFYRVRDFVESIVARDNFSTLRYEKRLRERKRVKDVVTTVDPSRGIASRRGEEIAVPTPVYDPVSIIYYIRRLDLTPGNSLAVKILSDRRVYDTEIEVLRRETVTVPAGTFRTIVVQPRLGKPEDGERNPEGQMQVWLSDDERRLPVRIRTQLRAGAITASLRSVGNGGSGAASNLK
ncbi:MAG: DUF3108 domain-containing protein [Thermoanaerobaculia bacterium]